jgi:hypothetical protein
MSDKNTGNTFQADAKFNMALGWMTAAAVSIASWAGIA